MPHYNHKVLRLFTAACLFASTAFIHAESFVFSKSHLKIGETNISLNNSGDVLTKTHSSTGEWLGEQKFKKFNGMMYVPEHNMLFVAGMLLNGNQQIIIKIKGTGGGGRNMFAVAPDGGPVSGYDYRIGSQSMAAKHMSYSNDTLFVDNGTGIIYKIRNVGGGGYNMFALDNNSCESLPNYNYFIDCSYY